MGSGPGAEQDLGLGFRQPSGVNASQMQFESEEDLLLEDGYASQNEDTIDEAGKAFDKVKKMQQELQAQRGKTFKTWNFTKRMVSLEKHRY